MDKIEIIPHDDGVTLLIRSNKNGWVTLNLSLSDSIDLALDLLLAIFPKLISHPEFKVKVKMLICIIFYALNDSHVKKQISFNINKVKRFLNGL